MTFRARMADVAAVAGVGVSTVSNVLNHPHKVAAATRERVQRAIEQLEFQPSEEAVKLRLGRGAKGMKSHPQKETNLAPTGDDALTRKEGSPRESEAIPEVPQQMAPGTRVDVVASGRVIGSGILEVSMPDGSATWLWLDNGGGRRLIHSCDGVEVRAADNP